MRVYSDDGGESLEESRLAPKVNRLGARYSRRGDTTNISIDDHESIGGGIRQAPQQDRVHHAEHGDVGAD